VVIGLSAGPVSRLEIVGSAGAPCLEDRGVVNLIQDRSFP